jgi:ABC-2 type transport system permease protein
MFLSLVRLFIRTLATRGRILVLALLAIGMIGLCLVTGNSDDPQTNTWGLFSLYALGGLVPIASLVMGSSAFGDLVDDRTLVHLWLRPVSRPIFFAAAWVATLILVTPFTVIAPLVGLALGSMSSNAIGSSAIAAILGTLAYSAIFVALGLRMKRALAWGLAYILIWEGAVANAGAGLAKLSIRLSTRSIAHRGYLDQEIKFPLATTTASIALCVVTLCALILGSRWLRKAEVA